MADALSELLKKQPVLAALATANVPILVAFVNELATKEPSGVTAGVIGIALVLLNVVGVAARNAVTPVADPQTNDGVPLVPIVPDVE